MNYKDIEKILMNELRLMYYPIAVKYLFEDEELQEFKENNEYYIPKKPLTFCQAEIGPRMQGKTVLITKDSLGCKNAAFVLGWKSMDDKEIDSHLKYCKDGEQAERFVKTKPRLPEGELKGIVISTLGNSFFKPDTIHFYCDNMQAYHLLVFYMAALNIHPLRTNITINSSACGGNVYSYLEKTANFLPPCSGSYNSGKTERGEVNVIIPGEHIEETIKELYLIKERYGSSSFTREGDPFPGADICKNCPLIHFKRVERIEK